MAPASGHNDERRLALALGGYFFLLMATLYLMKPARNALFLEDLGADRLPWVYIATAIVTWWVVVAYVRLAAVTDLQRIIRSTLILALVSLLGFSGWLAVSPTTGAPVFYVWVKIFAVLLPSQLWLLSEELLDPRQARRLFGPIGSGGIMGGIVGSGLAAGVATLLGTEWLLISAAAATGGALGLFELTLASRQPINAPRGLARPDHHTDAASGDGGATSTPHDRSLVMTITAILVIATMAHTIVDWQFNKTAESILDQDQRATFFASFFTILNIITLAIQVLGTSLVLRYFGIGVALSAMPAAIAAGAVGILAYPTLLTTTLARGADDALRLSVDQSGRELLFLPFSAEDRRRLKPRIDLIASRVANGAAGVAILAAVWWVARPLQALSLLALLLVAVWAILVVRARRQYAHSLERLLSVRDLDIAGLARSRLDAAASTAIRRGLQAADDKTVEAALALAEHTDPRAFIDELRGLLRDSGSDELRSHALRLLAAADDQTSVDDTLADLDPGDTSAAAEALAYACTTHDAEARERIFEYIADAEVPIEPDVLRSTLGDLLADEDVHVVRGALAACARFPDTDLVLAICAAGSLRSVEGSALLTLQTFGDPAIGALTGILADPRKGRPRRVFAARALGRVGGAEASAGLIAGLVADDRFVRHASLKALNYMRRRGEELHIGRDREAAAIDIEWRDFLSLHRITAALGEPGTDSPQAFVATVLHERLWEAQERLFRALALHHPIQTIFFAYRGLITGDLAARSHAIELVDSIVETPQRRTLVRLLEAGSRIERGRIAGNELERPTPTPEAALRELLDPGDPWLAACAIRALPRARHDVSTGLRQELRAQGYAPLTELIEEPAAQTGSAAGGDTDRAV